MLNYSRRPRRGLVSRRAAPLLVVMAGTPGHWAFCDRASGDGQTIRRPGRSGRPVLRAAADRGRSRPLPPPLGTRGAAHPGGSTARPDLPGCGEAALGALRFHRALCDPAAERSAARMDAALKRSRSEEPAELPPPAREVEEKEEEEERMEQGLEEEEEVDPRIQVRRGRGAHGPTRPRLPRKSASTRTHALQPRVSSVAGWRPFRFRTCTEAWDTPFHDLPAGDCCARVDVA